MADYNSAHTGAAIDAAVTKLAGIEEGATSDLTGAEIKALYEALANTNAYTDAEKALLATALQSETSHADVLVDGDIGVTVQAYNSGTLISDPTGVTGADAITNVMSLTTAEYNAITTPDTATLYVITD